MVLECAKTCLVDLENLQIFCKISRFFKDFFYHLQILAGLGLAGL